jgi:hypothetical protein
LKNYTTVPAAAFIRESQRALTHRARMKNFLPLGRFVKKYAILEAMEN